MLYTLDMGLLGEQEVDVDYVIHKEERQTRDDPGCPAECEVLSVTWRGVDLMGDIDKDTWSHIEEWCFEDTAAEYESAQETRAEMLRDEQRGL